MDQPSPTSTPSPTLGPSQTMTSAATITLSGPSVPTSKRDKRRLNLTERYVQLTNLFASQKDIIYRDTLQTLQNTLAELHMSTEPEYVEKLIDLEEERDAELVSLYLYEQYLLERTEREYERDVQAAEEEYEAMAMTVREHLLGRLETQKRKLREDRELLDIANDHSLLLSVAGYQTPGSPGGSSSGIMGSVGERRKNLRRRGEMVAAATALDGKKRKRTGRGGDRDELAAFWIDREPLPFGYHKDDAPSSSRHREKSFVGLQGLKPDESNDDMAIIRKKKKQQQQQQQQRR